MTSCCGSILSIHLSHGSRPIRRSISASSIHISRSWCCRSTPRWKKWTKHCWKRQPILVAHAGKHSGFIPIVGEYVIPDLLGGSESQMIGQTLWTEFFSNRDWPVASAIAMTLLALLLIPIVIYERIQRRAIEGGLQ